MASTVKIVFSFILSLVFVASKAQSILEKVQLNLPKDIKWKLLSSKIEEDSTEQFMVWIPANETKDEWTQLLEVLSVEKKEMEAAMPSDSFYQYIKNKLLNNKTKVDTANVLSFYKNNGVVNPDVRFHILKGIPKNRQDTSQSMMLQWCINGKTSVHILNITTSKNRFTPLFIEKWKKVFADARIIQPAVTILDKTNFTLGYDGKSVVDSNTLYNLKEAIRARIKLIYKRNVEDNYFVMDKNLIRFTLRGSIDTGNARQVLTHKASSADVVFLKADTSITEIRKQVDDLQQLPGNAGLLHVFSEDGVVAHRSEIGYAMAKDTLAVRKLLEKITIPESKAFYFRDETGYDQIAYLYLLEKEPLINADELIACYSAFDGNGFPGITMELNNAGKGKLAYYTKNNTGGMLAILVKGKILSTAVITGEIPDGKLFLAGGRMTMMEIAGYLNKIGYPYPIPLTTVDIERTK